SSAILSRAAGRLPSASNLTIFQSTVPRRPCAQLPPILVSDAYNKSVPTAVAGATPNASTSSGVINEPPPTPVTPTMNPTRKPEHVYNQSIQWPKMARTVSATSFQNTMDVGTNAPLLND